MNLRTKYCTFVMFVQNCKIIKTNCEKESLWPVKSSAIFKFNVDLSLYWIVNTLINNCAWTYESLIYSYNI